jgi:kynureninase
MTLAQLREQALELDRVDPLASYREQFCIPRSAGGDECTYLCGNSLGLAPRKARAYVEQELLAWEELGVEGHFKEESPWVSFHELFAEPLGRIVGARPSEVVAMNTLTVNLHLMLTTFYRPTPTRFKVLVGHTPFPSDRYAIASQIALHGFSPADALIVATPQTGEHTLRTTDVLELIQRHGSEIALVILDGVNYCTGEYLDIAAITAAAHRVGITAGFDLAHAAGNVPLDLHGWDVDFAVWCSYKYLNGGPGCVAGCFVHERHGNRLPPLPRCAGWWGHDKGKRFQMGPDFSPITGAEGWQLSNPPLFSLAALRASLELFSEAGMERLRAKSELLTGLLDQGLREHFADWIEVLTPPDTARRGCQLSIRPRSQARQTFTRLGERGVICDWREPDVIRLAPVPFYNRFADVFRCLEVLAECVK